MENIQYTWGWLDAEYIVTGLFKSEKSKDQTIFFVAAVADDCYVPVCWGWRCQTGKARSDRVHFHLFHGCGIANVQQVVGSQ